MRRTRIEIMLDILSASYEGANKTKIVYRAFLNFKQAEEYLGLLLKENLLMERNMGNKKVYQTTDKGVEMLEKYNEFIKGLTI